jgi:hypothetical protein
VSVVRAYSSLTNFHKEMNAMTGNGNHVNLLKKLVKSLHVNLFLAGFRPFEPLFGGGGTAAAESSLRQKSIESVARFQLLTAPPQHIPTSKGGLFPEDIFNLVPSSKR